MKYQNPIIKAFNPDPSICKVGKEYYLVTSTFEYYPGIALYFSTDLVNWTLIGNCINRHDQLPMEKTSPSGGIWAPTIRYWDGTFYVTATFCELGNFIIHANKNDMNWSDPIWISMEGIDPSIYFEEGKAYYCTNQKGADGREGISLAEIDISTGEIIGDIKYIWSGMQDGYIEAPHIYRIEDWYYLIVAEGGTETNHMVNIARSRHIWGPYEGCPLNPILTNRNDASRQILCTGHGDLVFDNDEKLWMVHLGTRPSVNRNSHLGRETFLSPMKLSKGWVLAENPKAQLQNESPGKAIQIPILTWKDNFYEPEFGPEWLFIKNMDIEKYLRKEGHLILSPSKAKLSGTDSPVFAGVRPLEMTCDISTIMQFTTEKVGDEAGLVLYLSPKFHYKLAKKSADDGDYIIVEKLADDFNQIAFCKKIKNQNLSLLIKARKEKFEFYYAEKSGELNYMCSASTRFLACEIDDKSFTGMVVGLFAQCDINTGAKAIFSKFKQQVSEK